MFRPPTHPKLGQKSVFQKVSTHINGYGKRSSPLLDEVSSAHLRCVARMSFPTSEVCYAGKPKTKKQVPHTCMHACLTRFATCFSCTVGLSWLGGWVCGPCSLIRIVD